jgi:hypothetical protein
MVLIKTCEGMQSYPVLDLLVLYICDRMDVDVDDFQRWVREEYDADISLRVLREARNRASSKNNSGSADDVPQGGV